MPVSSFKIEDYLPFGLGLNDVIALMAGLAVVAMFFAIWHALRADTSFERRLTHIVDRKEAMRQAAISSRRQRARLTPATVMQELVTRLDLLRSHHATEARLMLARAGLRSREAMIRYLFFRLVLPLTFAAAVMLDNYTLKLLPIPQGFSMLAGAAAGVFGFFAPGIYLRNITGKRAHRMQLALPDALDLMVICAEAGLSLDSTLQRVSRELEGNSLDLAEEFGITAAELTFLPDRRQAFENLNNRTDLPAMRGVVNTLTQTAKFGTPLAQSLRVLATEYRDARLFKAEEKAARLPALMTVPMIIFILPTLFIVLMGPATLGIIDTFNGSHRAPRQVTVVQHDNKPAPKESQETKVTVVHANDKPAETPEPPAAPPMPTASVAPAQATAVVGQPIKIEIDARVLAPDFELQAVIVPVGTADGVSDPASFFAEAAPVEPAQVEVTLTPRRTGPNEVRLYYIPHFGTAFTVAARAEIAISPAP